MHPGWKLLQIARPQFLIASLAVYISGAGLALLAQAPFDLGRLALGYLITAAVQLSVSYSNDTYDVGVDGRGVPTLFSGGSGVLVAYPALRRPALRVAVALTIAALGLTLWFMARYDFPFTFLIYVAVCSLLSWLYSAPPARLVSRGLGEVVLAFISGCLLPGMGYWVTAGRLDGQALSLSLPLTALGLTFTLAVSIPDEETDRQAHKQTWVARWGRRFGFNACAVCILMANLFFWLAPGLSFMPATVDTRLLAVLSLLPLTAGSVGAIWHPADRRRATFMVYAILVTVGAFLALIDFVLLSAAAR